MSIANLITTGNKSYQDLSIDSLICREANITDLDANNIITSNSEVLNLFVDNVNARFPATEIDFNNNVEFNGNNLLGIGTLTATTIIGDISDDIIDINEINQKDFGFVQINNDFVMINNSSNKITDDIIAVASTQTGLHIQNQSNAKLWLEADTDNNGVGDPTLSLSGKANELLYQVDTVFGPAGCVRHTVAQAGGEFADHEFYTGICTNTAKNTLNSFSVRNKRFDIGPSQVNSYVDFDANNNDLLNIKDCEIQNDLDVQGEITNSLGDISVIKNINMFAHDLLGINQVYTNTISSTLGFGGNISSLSDLLMTNNNIGDIGTLDFQTTPVLNNVATKIMCLDAGDTVQYRDITTFPSTNPFDQDLNVANNVQFNQVTTNEIISDFDANKKIRIVDGGAFDDYIQLAVERCIMANYCDIGSIADPGTIGLGASGGRLYSTGASNSPLWWKTLGGGDIQLNTVFGTNSQYEVSEGESVTTSSVTWSNKITLTTPIIQAGDYKIEYSCQITADLATQVVDVRLQEDSVPELESTSYDIVTANNWGTVSEFYIATLTNAVHVFELDWKGNSGVQDYKIREATVMIYRVA